MSHVEHKRGNVFDFLRLFAAVAVVVLHGTTLLQQPFLWHGLDDNFWFFDGVAMFFIMSGMFVFVSAERTHAATGKWWDYFRNRYLRIAPAVYVYTLAMLLIVPLLGAARWGDLISMDVLKWLALSLALVPGYDAAAFTGFGTGILNGAVWTIPAEVSFYVAVPVLFLLARRIGFKWMMIISAPVAVIAPVVSHLASPGLANLLHHTFLEYFSCFLLGMFWSRYWKAAPKHWALFALSVVLYVAALYLPPKPVAELLDPLLIAIPLSYATVWFGYQGPLALKRFTDAVGDLSFGTYLWHWPVINLFLWAGWNPGALTVPLVLIFTLVLGWLSWHLVERPALRRKRVSARAETPTVAIPGARHLAQRP
ncbi:acyltransferase family protein [Arthrobacter sp. SAFR-014]|uniref:acyltransferase family protein n=1 Tax=unclassified Arthrobacter TaxID=235627 RepID=UPI003F7BEAD6